MAPQNLDFLLDRTSAVSVPNPIEEGAGAIGALLSFVVVLLSGVAVIRVSDGGSETTSRIMVWVIFAFIAYYGVGVAVGQWHNQRITFRLTDAGEIKEGRILQCKGSFRPSGKGKQFYQVTVDYRFTTADGTPVTATRTASRKDLYGQALPPPDTPVYVLYLSEKEYYLM